MPERRNSSTSNPVFTLRALRIRGVPFTIFSFWEQLRQSHILRVRKFVSLEHHLLGDGQSPRLEFVGNLFGFMNGYDMLAFNVGGLFDE
jgi:hypothetical protein